MKNSTITKPLKFSLFGKIRNFIVELDLIYCASDLAKDFGFKNTYEMNEMLSNAMSVCLNEGISIEENFKLFYKNSDRGLAVDYKLSAFAYKLICLNPRYHSFQNDCTQTVFLSN